MITSYNKDAAIHLANEIMKTQPVRTAVVAHSNTDTVYIFDDDFVNKMSTRETTKKQKEACNTVAAFLRAVADGLAPGTTV